MIEGKKADKRKRIVQSATKIFAEKGFYNAKISQIAYHADVADGTIYLYFKSKDDLLISIFEEEMTNIIEYHIEEIEKEKKAGNRLITFAKNHAQLCIENEDLAALFQLEIRQSNKFMKDYVNLQFSNYLNVISSILKYGKETNEFRSDTNVNMLKHAFFGAIDEISTQWILLGDSQKRFNLMDSLRSYSELIVRGIKV
jgi:TetR/AcrR family transcriptional regulator, fatty acid metabolism regulator protein